jgi:SRSO17 transposase
MKPSHESTSSAIQASDVIRWRNHLCGLHQRLRPYVARPEPWKRALLFFHALLSEVPRKNGWQMAEHAREATPDGMQRFLAEAVWDEDGVRDDVRRLAVETLGREHAVLAIDETCFLKQGQHSAGVARQYCGSTGRTENCLVGVFLSWVTPRGHFLIDRALSLPACWTDDPARCLQAGIPASVPFRTKPEHALQMLKRLYDQSLRPEWVVADTVYGGNPTLREWLEEQGQADVGMVPCTEPIVLTLPDGSLRRIEVGERPALLPESTSWKRLAISQGPKGPRSFDWLCVPMWHRGREDGPHCVLLRRFLDEPKTTFALVFAPEPTSLSRLVEGFGCRWPIEEDVENGKHLGMDHYEVRPSCGWYRSLMLVLLILAFLASLPVHEHLELSLREVLHLLARLLFVLPSGFSLVLAWSAWRQWHGKLAAIFHLRRRLKAGERSGFSMVAQAPPSQGNSRGIAGTHLCVAHLPLPSSDLLKGAL